MLAVAIIIVVLVVLIPVGFLMSTSVVAALMGTVLTNEAEDDATGAAEPTDGAAHPA